ncbi:hypothetical protein [Streptomyces sp. LaBMicrA B280]|uniref:hypothetical protein n=1 Tax=Streptomyces sp. LaBMicrA B280 TaxID=3391001 RepID=UPI003BA72B04
MPPPPPAGRTRRPRPPPAASPARADVSPPIALSGVPAGTRSLAVTVRGLDAHTRRLSAGAHPPGAVEGRDGFGRTGYSGPCPPPGDHPSPPAP